MDILNHPDTLIMLIISILMVLLSMYNKIKYLCLKKATEKVAEVEKIGNLSGGEKFSLVVLWIENDLPKIFTNSVVRSFIQELVQFAYDNSFKYAKRYVKRKTGYDLSELIENVKKASDDESDETK